MSPLSTHDESWKPYIRHHVMKAACHKNLPFRLIDIRSCLVLPLQYIDKSCLIIEWTSCWSMSSGMRMSFAFIMNSRVPQYIMARNLQMTLSSLYWVTQLNLGFDNIFWLQREIGKDRNADYQDSKTTKKPAKRCLSGNENYKLLKLLARKALPCQRTQVILYHTE